MARTDLIEAEGRVTESLPDGTYRVCLPNGHEVMARITGKVRLSFIRILPGDKVMVEMSPQDLTRGRITFRHK